MTLLPEVAPLGMLAGLLKGADKISKTKHVEGLCGDLLASGGAGNSVLNVGTSSLVGEVSSGEGVFSATASVLERFMAGGGGTGVLDNTSSGKTRPAVLEALTTLVGATVSTGT